MAEYEFSTRVQEFDECDYIGPVLFEDLDGRKFFSGARVHNMNVNVGDLVRVVLEDGEIGDDKDMEDSYGFCQVLAIYDEKDTEVRQSEGVHFEARWFSIPDELDAKRKKIFPDELPNELIETDVMDDIPIGSVSGHIQVLQGSADVKSSKTAPMSTTSVFDSYFVCRYMVIEGSYALQPVHVHSMFARGMALSHYRYAYVNYLSNLPTTDPRSTAARKTGMGAGGEGEEGVFLDENLRYSEAIRKLHVSVLPSKLPCRTDERNMLYNMLKTGIAHKESGQKPVYISGMPGTGKTATVLATINELRDEAVKGLLPAFNFVEINCLRLQSPAQAYAALWRGLTGLHAASERAKRLLKERFESATSSEQQRAAADENMTVVLVDELDYLLTRDDSVVYNFFNWPMLPHSLLIVIGVANVMDLPERLHSRVTSRAGLPMLRMVFRPYEHEQIAQILKERISDLQLSLFSSDATLNLLSRKAATAAGDLRAALKICQRTIELYRNQKEDIRRRKAAYEAQVAAHAEQEAALANKKILQGVSANSMPEGTEVIPLQPPVEKPVSTLINMATAEYKESPMMATVSRMCALDKAIMIAACKHLRSTDNAEMAAEVLWDRLHDLLKQARQNPDVTLLPPPQFIFDEALDRLVKQGLFEVTGRRGEARYGAQSKKYMLRMEFTDVVACLKEDIFAKFL